MSVTKWKVFCEDEQDWISGYTDTYLGKPTECYNSTEHTINPLRIKQLELLSENFSNKVTYWKIYCQTESAWVYGYSSEEPYPEYCFHDKSHVARGKPVALRSLSSNYQKIKEEYIDTGGFFQTHSYKLLCTPGTTVHDYTFPYPITALSVKFTTESQHTDDQLLMEVAPDTLIGVVTVGVSENDAVFTVSDTVMDNVSLGHFIKITDGVNTDDLGKVITVNTTTNQITLNTACTHSFPAGAYILLTVRVIDNYTIGYPGRYILGESKIGGSYVPKDTVVRVKYINNGESTKNFYSILEMLY